MELSDSLIAFGDEARRKAIIKRIVALIRELYEIETRDIPKLQDVLDPRD